MQKIPTLFLRDENYPKLVTSQVDEEAAWVTHNEGQATVKFDGTCCAFWNGIWYARHRHRDEQGSPPEGWIHWSLTGESGHGWLPVSEENPSHRYHLEAVAAGAHTNGSVFDPPIGTYELVGPKVQSNPYGQDRHVLWKHGSVRVQGPAREFGVIRDWLSNSDVEGIVWHHHDGRMAKIKRTDFGLPWPLNKRRKTK